MISFKIGDKIIYPNQGLGIIEDIQEKNLFGEEFKIYHVRLFSNDTLILIPSINADEMGIRKPVDENSIEKFFGFMRNGGVDVSLNWKGRFKEHTELMKSGDMLDVAMVLKSLYYLNLTKPLSFREKKMMEKALELIVSEISEVASISNQAIEKKVMDSLSCCFDQHKQHLDS